MEELNIYLGLTSEEAEQLRTACSEMDADFQLKIANALLDAKGQSGKIRATKKRRLKKSNSVIKC